jgi:hypothetical protein
MSAIHRNEEKKMISKPNSFDTFRGKYIGTYICRDITGSPYIWLHQISGDILTTYVVSF